MAEFTLVAKNSGGATVMSGRKSKGAQAYRELAENLLAYWTAGAALRTYTADA